jgi:site-specific DNA-methyltransferase (cytosine-N4-specific)
MLIQSSTIPIADEKIDSVITSIPYFFQRMYDVPDVVWGGDPNCKHEWEPFIRKGKFGGTNSKMVKIKGSENFQIISNQKQAWCKCGAWKGQYGQEPLLQMYIDHTVEIFREVRRVLKPEGTLWLNCADTYSGSGGAGGDYGKGGLREGQPKYRQVKQDNMKPKDLMGVPWKIAEALRDDGWYWRQWIPWVKENPFPHPVTDRPSTSIETIHIFSKSKRYYFDMDAAKEQLAVKRNWRNGDYLHFFQTKTSSFKGQHFAAWPPDLVRPMIAASCPPEGIVLDPFVGTGTTVLVAQQMGRKGIGIDLSFNYLKMAKERISPIEIGKWPTAIPDHSELQGYPLFGGTSA